jgi:CRISPR-associated protein Csd2
MTISNRYDFVLLFDVRDGNPNGDPDAGNLPRVDAETGRGLVTDVSLKRKVRNYVGIVKGEQPPYEIYVKEKAVLNRQHERAYQALGLKSEPKKLPKEAEKAREIVGWMCHNFYDIRTFGAVMATEVNSGQVRGPVQLTFARSIDPIVSQEHAITRMAVTNERDLEKERTIGRKHTVPYGLYVAHGFVSAFLAQQSGFSEEDLKLLWDALINMFEHDRSAARGEMATRGLYVFRHESELGNAPAYSLFSRITASLKDGATVPREFTDYEVRVNIEALPSGVTLERHVG